jgi:signal transduction histidine kinase/FixJ family two-component response regulator
VYRATVLVIDDDELICDILKTGLTDAGFAVDSALDPVIAMKKFREQRYDSVIVDVMLPGISGTDLLEQFKTIDPDISVILVTGHPAVETAQKAVQLAAFDYISKPFELREIISKTKTAVEKTQKLREKKERETILKARLTENLKEIEFQSTAHKIEQERFYGVFKSANFGLIVLNGLDEKIILLNQHCKRLFSILHLSDQQCFDKDYHHLLPPAISGVIDTITRKIVEDPTVINAEAVNAGSRTVLEFQSYPVMSEGVMLAIAIIVNDVTERKSLEKQLLQASKLAGIGELAAGIAHEINNPISFIKSNMGTLNEYVDELTRLVEMYHDLITSVEKGKDSCEIVSNIKSFEREIDSNFVLNDLAKVMTENQDGLSRVAKIIRDLRTFTHFDEEKKSVVSINKVVEEALTLTRNEIKYKAEVSTDLSEVPEIMGYGNQLAQVLVNLIINAVHAIEKKGNISIRSLHDGKNIIVEVTDNGKGIKEEHIEHIFDPFFTTKPRDEGTGLGLSIAQEIVTKHGGRITVQSKVGTGTTFRIELPLKAKVKEPTRI